MKKRVLVLFSFLFLFAANVLAQDVKGRIVNKSDNSPLQGVTINLKGTQVNTISDDQGNFSLKTSGMGPFVLFISYVGFQPMEIPATNADAITIELEPFKSNLNDVVVIGYGTVKRKDLTGSVVSVKGGEIRKVQSGNAIQALQGKMPGVDVVQASGTPGMKPKVTIRGNRSILANNDPLYIVDGIQYNNYQDIDPNDIESLDVLKDASSTAIYGSRGSNGVIIITTKKGLNGKAKIGLGAYYGETEKIGYPTPMNGPQYAELKRQAYRTIGTWNSVADDSKVFTSPADSAAVKDGSSYYWPGYLLNKGNQQNYSVNVSAGSEKTKVFFSYGFFGQKGLLDNDYSHRNTVRLNIDQYLANNLRVGLLSQFTHYTENLRTDNVLTIANKIIPFYSPYNADGSLARFPGNANQFNPMFDDVPGNYINENKISRILSTVYLNWGFAPGFNFRTNLGITNSSSRNGSFAAANSVDRSLSSGSMSAIVNASNTDVTWENIVTWNREFGKHAFEVAALTSYITSTNDSSSASGTGQLLPSQSFYALQNNPATISIASNYVSNTLLSGAFRINYNYAGKYFLTITGREDGSSVLSESNKWQFFPSAAAAWRISDESFMLNMNKLSNLKLRASYGSAGNSAVRPYSTQSGLQLVPFAWNDVQALAYELNPQTGNPDLKWELTKTLNFGLDFGFFNQRIAASIDWYNQQTQDLLLPRSLPPTSGVSRVAQNIGKTQNQGIEIGLNTVNIQNQHFTWTTGFTYTMNKEKIVDLVGGQNDVANNWFIGYPVNSFYDYDKVGIWQTSDSSEALVYGRKPGDIKVRDVNGDKKITATDDRVVLGSAVPNYTFGFNNDFKIYDFDLNVYIYARQGQMFVDQYALKFEPNAIENSANVDYWTPENPTNNYPRPNANISRTSLPFATTVGYRDGSFVKIRNITLGYTLPVSLAGKAHINRLRIYVSAQNFFTFSKIKDYDPENAGSFERPLSKMILAGINIDF